MSATSSSQFVAPRVLRSLAVLVAIPVVCNLLFRRNYVDLFRFPISALLYSCCIWYLPCAMLRRRHVLIDVTRKLRWVQVRVVNAHAVSIDLVHEEYILLCWHSMHWLTSTTFYITYKRVGYNAVHVHCDWTVQFIGLHIITVRSNPPNLGLSSASRW